MRDNRPLILAALAVALLSIYAAILSSEPVLTMTPASCAPGEASTFALHRPALRRLLAPRGAKDSLTLFVRRFCGGSFYEAPEFVPMARDAASKDWTASYVCEAPKPGCDYSAEVLGENARQHFTIRPPAGSPPR
jgi:hypothetical protein